ncbi:hypothetical protein ACUN24_09090 [Pedobacter sp. WC2501]|uniref:hypothetical protein n=1 Tax=Pedobacter sp. WC2501 TaxID=3461400 RepID=UPI0040463F93
MKNIIMKLLIILGLLNLNTACHDRPKVIVKSINNDKQLRSISDSLQKVETPKIKQHLKRDIPVIADKAYFEDGIEESLASMFRNKNSKDVDDKISEIEKDPKINAGEKRYWKSYLLYNESLYYKSALKDSDKASKLIDKAIEELEENLKTSEDYALYAACKSFSVQFANMTQLGKIAAQVSENANKSLELNVKNIRAYYVLASNNFYTPKMFGGSTKVEEYAIKGLACPNSLDENFYSPYWGKPHLYSILIRYLQAENRKDDADKYRKLAKNEFPNQF